VHGGPARYAVDARASAIFASSPGASLPDANTASKARAAVVVSPAPNAAEPRDRSIKRLSPAVLFGTESALATSVNASL